MKAGSRIVVTGATGFIGRYLVPVLAERGYRVRAVVRRAVAEPMPREIEVYEITDLATADWTQILTGAEAVMHLAAMAHRPEPRSSAECGVVRSVNVDAVSRLTAAAVTSGVRRLVLLSSIGVLGATSGKTLFHRGSVPAPHDFYSWTKLEAERAAAGAASGPLELSIVRPPLVFGPDAPGNFGRLVRFIRKGVPLPLAALHNKRSFVSVWNLCDFLLACLERPGAIGAPLLVADREAVSTAELVRLCRHLLGMPPGLIYVPAPIIRLGAKILGRGSDIERLSAPLVVDSSDSESRLEWSPPLMLREGLRRALGVQ